MMISAGDASMTEWTQSQQVTKGFLCLRQWRKPLLRTHTVLRPDLRLRPKGPEVHFDAHGEVFFCLFVQNIPLTGFAHLL